MATIHGPYLLKPSIDHVLVGVKRAVTTEAQIFLHTIEGEDYIKMKDALELIESSNYVMAKPEHVVLLSLQYPEIFPEFDNKCYY
jgi:hypothetical protein